MTSTTNFDDAALRNIAMKCHPYAPKIKILRHTQNPEAIIRHAVYMTMKKDLPDLDRQVVPEVTELFGKLISMNHSSLFEHISFTFEIRDISRSCLGQITRHRMGSFTSGSQHYQIYSEYDCFFDERWYNHTLILDVVYESLLKYRLLLASGCPREEARQVLPMAMGTNIIWTVNLRSLINFLNLRLCGRNCKEIRLVAEKILSSIYDIIPNISNYIGPDCHMRGYCTQGILGKSCEFNKGGTKWKKI